MVFSAIPCLVCLPSFPFKPPLSNPDRGYSNTLDISERKEINVRVKYFLINQVLLDELVEERKEGRKEGKKEAIVEFGFYLEKTREAFYLS